ncbi:MAG: GNAT family N-acetyltransferase [Gemmatimonadetes bacterium]|nr:GNAT family N-acetyltransferase [Gemmatimonadota bacterium]
MTTVRAATVDDAGEIARLLTMLGHPTTEGEVRERWEGWAAEQNVGFVAEREGGGLAGAITLHVRRLLHRPLPVGRVTALIVDEAVRGRGVGRALIGAAEERFASAGCGIVEITSNLSLTAAHAFYQRIGYGQTGVRLAKSLRG